MPIGPDDVRRDLERKAAGTGAPESARAEAGAPLSDLEKAVLSSISASYFWLRRGLGAIALLFPLLLWLRSGRVALPPSVSDYYHYVPGGVGHYGDGVARDLFVGVLCAVGAFLWFYKGYRKDENWALNVAGLAAFGIALFPMDLRGTPDTTKGLVHGSSAVTYFLAIAYVCLFRAKDTLRLLRDPARERRFRTWYNGLGAAMVIFPVASVVLHWSDEGLRRPGGPIYWVEVSAIVVFAAFWLVKSREVRAIEKRSEKPQAP